MKLPFDLRARQIIVRAELAGKVNHVRLRLLLDTGASFSVVSGEALALAGYDVAAEGVTTSLTTGSGVEAARQLFVRGFAALGLARTNFPIVCYDLPAAAGVDGVVGLDFLRGHVLTLDFVNGILTFE